VADFFVSYNQADRNWAEWLAWVLEEASFSTVLQAWDFGPGRNFVLAMHRAAQEAERTLLVLSPSYLASRFTQPEWAAAFAQDPTGEKGLLVPVRVKACEVAGLLGPIVYLDLVGLSEAAAREALLAGIRRARGDSRGKPVVAPPFPGIFPATNRGVPEHPLFPGQ
jgi:hypothetical protein